jgi:hypothetical protein
MTEVLLLLVLFLLPGLVVGVVCGLVLARRLPALAGIGLLVVSIAVPITLALLSGATSCSGEDCGWSSLFYLLITVGNTIGWLIGAALGAAVGRARRRVSA